MVSSVNSSNLKNSRSEKARQVLRLVRDDEKVITGSFASRSEFFNRTFSHIGVSMVEQIHALLTILQSTYMCVNFYFWDATLIQPAFSEERRSNYGFINEVFSVMSNKSYLPTVASVKMAWKAMGLEDAVDIAYAGEGVDKV